MIYFFWFLGQIVLLIVFLNFVIALISQHYESVMDNSIQHTYVMMQELNNEFDMFFEFFSKHNLLKKKGYLIDTILLIDATSRERDEEWEGLS